MNGRDSAAIHLLTPEEWANDDRFKSHGVRQTRFFTQGWRFSVTCGSLLASLVFLLNLITTLYVRLKHANAEKEQNVIFDGDCEQAKRLNTLVHLLINALSTALLSASNYAMQCVTGPTRKEIDAAHTKRCWLDIGVLSMRNLRSISRKRFLLWLVLTASSLPLHLFYNSAVYSVVVANDYYIFSATPAMLEQPNASLPLGADPEDAWPDDFRVQHSLATRLLDEYRAGKLEQLDNAACIKAYATTFPTTRSNLILVYDHNTTKLSAPVEYITYDAIFEKVRILCQPDPYHWICGHSGAAGSCSWDSERKAVCSEKIADLQSVDWKPYRNQRFVPSYCLSESVPAHCALQFSPHIAWTVIAGNLIKVMALIYTAFGIQETPLLTFGDGVASFLTKSDATTKDLCLMGKRDVKQWQNQVKPLAIAYTDTRLRWRQAVSAARWWICLLLYFTVLSTCTGLFIYGLAAGVASTRELMAIGLGEPDPRSLISWKIPSDGTNGLLINVIIANIPQLILSGVYYTYNGVFTTFWLAQEGNEYAIKRKSLRVSTAKRGAQRTSYFLQLPYRFGIPLIAISGILHWLCSQSIYVVIVNTSSDGEHITCGYSPPAILAVIIIGLVMVAGMILAGRRRLPSAMPVAASCSASNSALCHPPQREPDKDVATKLLRWGVSDNRNESQEASDVGHCSFSSEDVDDLVESMPYAGLSVGRPFLKALSCGRRHR